MRAHANTVFGSQYTKLLPNRISFRIFVDRKVFFLLGIIKHCTILHTRKMEIVWRSFLDSHTQIARSHSLSYSLSLWLTVFFSFLFFWIEIPIQLKYHKKLGSLATSKWTTQP